METRVTRMQTFNSISEKQDGVENSTFHGKHKMLNQEVPLHGYLG